MTITKNQNGSTLEVALEGRLDTTSAPELESALGNSLSSIETLIFDFSKVEYVSSAGIRTLLVANRSLKMGGSTKIINANEIVKAVFDITGMTSILNVE